MPMPTPASQTSALPLSPSQRPSTSVTPPVIAAPGLTFSFPAPASTSFAFSRSPSKQRYVSSPLTTPSYNHHNQVSFHTTCTGQAALPACHASRHIRVPYSRFVVLYNQHIHLNTDRYSAFRPRITPPIIYSRRFMLWVTSPYPPVQPFLFWKLSICVNMRRRGGAVLFTWTCPLFILLMAACMAG